MTRCESYLPSTSSCITEAGETGRKCALTDGESKELVLSGIPCVALSEAANQLCLESLSLTPMSPPEFTKET